MRIQAGSLGKQAFLLLGALAMVFPFYWMLTTSFKSFAEAGQFPPTLLPTAWHLENWSEAWTQPNAFWESGFRNSIVIGALVTLADLATAVLAGYAFARMRFRGRNVVFAVLLATLMIPAEATLIPNYILVSKSPRACLGLPCLGLYDSLAVQIIPFAAQVFSIFLLRQFFLSVPQELQDSATLDGAGQLRFLWSVALPLVRPALITVALVSMLASWNAFLWPLLVTSKDEFRPVQVVLAQFNQEYGSSYHLAMAGAAFVILPMVVVYLAAQKYFIEGIARTGIRG